MPAPATTPHTWPINTGVRITLGNASDLWTLSDGTPVTTGTLVLTVRDSTGTVLDTFSGTHLGSPDGTWGLDVDALNLTLGSKYDFELVGTPASGQPVTQRWWAQAAYLAPRFEIR